MILKRVFVILGILAFLVCKPTSEHGGKGIDFVNPWVRSVPPMSKVTGGYVEITNHGEDDRLISAKSELSEVVELHEMSESEGMMKMRKLENGIALPSHKTVVLRPGGNHLMFIGLKKNLSAGEKEIVVLEFEKAGTKEVEFSIGNPENPTDSGK